MYREVTWTRLYFVSSNTRDVLTESIQKGLTFDGSKKVQSREGCCTFFFLCLSTHTHTHIETAYSGTAKDSSQNTSSSSQERVYRDTQKDTKVFKTCTYSSKTYLLLKTHTQTKVRQEQFKNKCVRFVTMAPELSGASKQERRCENVMYCRLSGTAWHLWISRKMQWRKVYTMLTHLFNAMPSFHHRDPDLWDFRMSGCTWTSIFAHSLALSHATTPLERFGHQQVRDKFYYSLIADGIHSHPCSCAIANASHPNGLILVTDAMAAMGLEDGEHQLGEMRVKVKGNRAMFPYIVVPVVSAPWRAEVGRNDRLFSRVGIGSCVSSSCSTSWHWRQEGPAWCGWWFRHVER